MHVVVTEVEVRAIPFTAAGEERRWDLSSGPDLAYEVYGPDGDRLYASETVCDVRPSDLPLPLGGGFTVGKEGPHILRLLDEDLFDSEVVASVGFAPERLAEAGQSPAPPQCVQFEDGATTLWVALRWEEGP